MAFYFPVRYSDVQRPRTRRWHPLYSSYSPYRICNRRTDGYHPFWCDFEDDYQGPHDYEFLQGFPLKWLQGDHKHDECCNAEKRKASPVEGCVRKFPRKGSDKPNQEKCSKLNDIMPPKQCDIPIHRLEDKKPSQKWSHFIKLPGVDPDNIKITAKENRKILIEGYQEVPMFTWPGLTQIVKINKELVPPENVDIDKLKALFGDDGTLTLEAPFIVEKQDEKVSEKADEKDVKEEVEENSRSENIKDPEKHDTKEEVVKTAPTDESDDSGLEAKEAGENVTENDETADSPLGDIRLLFNQELEPEEKESCGKSMTDDEKQHEVFKTNCENQCDNTTNEKPHTTSAPHSMELPLQKVEGSQELVEEDNKEEKLKIV